MKRGVDAQFRLETLDGAMGLLPARRGISGPAGDRGLDVCQRSRQRSVAGFECSEAGTSRAIPGRMQVLARQIHQLLRSAVHHAPFSLPASVSETSARLVASELGW